MRKLTLGVQSVYLLILIPVMLLITLGLAWKAQNALHSTIMRGFDKQLVGISTVTGAFIDGDRLGHILAKKQIQGLAFNPHTQVFYGVDNTTGELVWIHPVTGGAETIGQTGFASVRDLAYDPQRRALYAIASAGLTTERQDADLVRLDPQSGQSSRIGTIGEPCYGLAFDAKHDTLYCSSTRLVRLDLATGTGRPIGPLGYARVNGLAFHDQTGTLYGIDAAQQILLTIDTVSGRGTPVAKLQPRSNLDPEAKAPPYLAYYLKRLSKTPITLSAIQLRRIERSPPHAPMSGLAFGPEHRALFASTTRLVSIEAATAVAKNAGFEGYWNELGREYLAYVWPMRRIHQKRGLTYMYTMSQKKNAPIGDVIYILDVNTDAGHSFVGDEDQFSGAGTKGNETIVPIFANTRVGKTHVSGVQDWGVWGLLKGGYAPIWNGQGEVVAVLGTDINVTILQRKTRVALLKTVLLGVLALLLAALVAYGITCRLVRPIRQLHDAALNVAAGNYDLTVPRRGPTEFVNLATAFNTMSLELKTSFEEKIEANWELEARVVRQELTRTLFREADMLTVSLSKTLCCKRFGADREFENVSGWVASESRVLLWFSVGSAHALDAARRRREISLVAQGILQRYEDSWDEVVPRLPSLFMNSVAGFVFMDANSGHIHTLTRAPIGALVIDASGVEHLALCDDRVLSLRADQACIVSAVPTIAAIRQEMGAFGDEIIVAEELMTSIEAMLTMGENPVLMPGGELTQAMVGVMSRYPWWHKT